MLKLFRHKGFQRPVFIGIILATVLTFVVSGILINQDDKKSLSSLAKFENRKINVQEYLGSYRAVQRQAGLMYGDKLAEMRSKINFKGEAWDRLLLLEYAKKNGIRATDKEVTDWITKQEGFRKDGKFDTEYYRMYVERAMRTTARQFEEEIREMLTIGKVQEKITGGLNIDDAALKEQYVKERTEKELVYGVVESDSVMNEIPVKDEEVDKLYESMKDVLLTEEGGKKRTPEEAKEEVKKKLREPEAKKAALKKLADAKAKIKEPADFEAVLTAEKIEPVKLAKYRKGTYPAGVWPSENLQNAVEGLELNGISEPFEVPKGAMIVKVAGVLPFDEKKFDEEKKSFREQVESKKGTEELQKILEEYRDKLSLNLELMKELFPEEEPAPPAAG